jgi:hypothetical protein
VKRSALIDLMAGVAVLAVVAIGLLDVLRRAPVGHTMAGDPGPTFLPSILLYLLFALGVTLIVIAGVRLNLAMTSAGEHTAAPPSEPAEDPVHESPRVRGWLWPILMMSSLVGYLWAMPRFGFVAVTLVFLVH